MNIFSTEIEPNADDARSRASTPDLLESRGIHVPLINPETILDVFAQQTNDPLARNNEEDPGLELASTIFDIPIHTTFPSSLLPSVVNAEQQKSKTKTKSKSKSKTQKKQKSKKQENTQDENENTDSPVEEYTWQDTKVFSEQQRKHSKNNIPNEKIRLGRSAYHALETRGCFGLIDTGYTDPHGFRQIIVHVPRMAKDYTLELSPGESIHIHSLLFKNLHGVIQVAYVTPHQYVRPGNIPKACCIGVLQSQWDPFVNDQPH